MSRMDTNAKRIIALAYFHRYGWIATMIACIAIWNEGILYIFGVGFIIFAIWSLVGYKCKWRHIYCSLQNAYRQKMTPNSIRWHQIKKSDVYGISLIYFALGLVLLIFMTLYG